MRAKGSLSRRSTFLLVTLIVVVGTVGGTAYTLWRLRAEAIDRHFDVASMYARVFEDHLTQNLKVIDLILVNSLVNASGNASDTVALSSSLRHAPYLRSLAVLDAKNAIVASSDPRNIGVRIVRSDFLPPTLEPRAILRAGLPLAGRDFHDGRSATPNNPAVTETQGLIPMLRDVALENNSWTTLLASVNTDYFLNYYGRSLTAKAGVVELLRDDGVLLLSTDTRRQPGARDHGGALANRMATEEFGRFEQRLEDGRAVLTAWRASRAFPFFVVLHMDKDSGLTDWRHEALRTLVVVLGVLSAGVGLAIVYFMRTAEAARQHHANAEQLRLRGAALEAAANAIIITDRKGRIEWANPAFCTLSGYTMEEALGQNPRDLIKSGRQTPADFKNLWRTILGGKVWRGEMINRRKDNTHYLEDQTITPVLDREGMISHFIAVKQDISDRKQNEIDLAVSHRHLGALIEAIPDAIFFKDPESRWIITNAAAKQLFRLHEIPWQGKTEMELAELHPEYQAAHETCLIDDEIAWKMGKLTLFSETVIAADGKVNEFEVRKMPIFDDQGRRQALVILGRDITENRRAETALQQSEARVQAILDAIPDFLFELGLDGRCHAYHSASTEFLAAPPQAFLGKLLGDVLPADTAAVVMAVLREASEGGNSVGRQLMLDLPQGGMWFELSAARKAELANEDPRFIVLARDITERKRNEERMKELSRHLVVVQESARRKLSGELHDRTSPNLAAIGVNLDIIAVTMTSEQSPMLSERLADIRALIEDTAASIREISSDLRPPVLDHGGLLAALDSYTKQFQRRTGIVVRVDGGQSDTRLTPELESALFRLAQEALTNCAKHSHAKSINLALCLDGASVILTVSDNGIGFDPELLGKATHAGGLGILTMREMAEFLGGKFSIESTPCKGTQVRIEIASAEGQT